MIHRSILLAAAGASALLLGGCGGTRNRGLESVHQPVVDRADYALDLRTAGAGLSPGEDRRLAGWLETMRVGYGDRVSVDDEGGAPAARAQVGRVLATYGLMVDRDAPVTASPVAPGAVRVVVSRMRASVPGCPDYSRDASNEFEAHTSSNYGCSANANLAAMVAAPGDLLHGREGAATVDPLQSGKAINAYRRAAPSGNGGTTIKAEKAGAN